MSSRLSNIEFVRIMAMALIILNHLAEYSGVLSESSELNRFFAKVCFCGGKTGVALFVLIGCHFLIGKRTLIKNIVKIWLYTVLVTFVLDLLCLHVFGHGIALYKCFFPIIHNAYWFVTVYIGLLLVAPWLSSFVQSLSFLSLRNLIVVLTILLCVFPSLLLGRDLYVNEFLWFCYLFCLLYFAEQLRINNKTRYIILLLSLFSFVAMAVCVSFSDILMPLRNSGSIFVVCFSMGIFLFFATGSMKQNAFVNFLGKGTFVAYLIHDNSVFRMHLWNDIFQSHVWVKSDLFIVWCVFVCFTVLFVGGGVSFLCDKIIVKIMNVSIVNRFIRFVEGKITIG